MVIAFVHAPKATTQQTNSPTLLWTVVQGMYFLHTTTKAKLATNINESGYVDIPNDLPALFRKVCPPHRKPTDFATTFVLKRVKSVALVPPRSPGPVLRWRRLSWGSLQQQLRECGAVRHEKLFLCQESDAGFGSFRTIPSLLRLSRVLGQDVLCRK